MINLDNTGSLYICKDQELHSVSTDMIIITDRVQLKQQNQVSNKT